MNIKQQTSLARLIRTSTAAAILLAGTGLATPALSQSGQVSVDLSVLEDGGYGPATIPGYAGGATKLLMPGPSAPKSTYVGPPVTVTAPIITAPTVSTTTVETTETSSASTLTAADVTPPPAPEAAEPEVPEVPDVLTAQPEPEPEASSGEAVALAPSSSEEEAPPPAAPEPVEEEAAESESTSDGSASAEQDATETAAATATATAAAAPGRAMQVVFAATESKLPGNADSELSAIAEQIKGSDDLRIQLMAYAGGDDLSASKARRLSLSRALSVRSFFIENGVRSTRIDVRALGDKTNEEPLNRVDINIVER